VFPLLIGTWFESRGATALPWAMLALGMATLAAFVGSNRALGQAFPPMPALRRTEASASAGAGVVAEQR
jgi:hypothetical protein